MSGLVGYGSSDDEGDHVQPGEAPRPAKVPKLDHARPSAPPAPSTAPAPGPAAPPPPRHPAEPSLEPSPDDPLNPPASPYTTERQALHTLTMPTHPTFVIPASPPPPSPSTHPDAAAALAATTKKFDRFLALKPHGVHFNARLAASASLRNPALAAKLREFAGVGGVEGYRGVLGEGDAEGGVRVRWGEHEYADALVRENERWEKKGQRQRQRQGRERVDFVPEAAGGTTG